MLRIYDSTRRKTQEAEPIASSADHYHTSADKTILQIVLEILGDKESVSSKEIYSTVKRNRNEVNWTINGIMKKHNLVKREVRGSTISYSLTRKGRILAGLPIEE